MKSFLLSLAACSLAEVVIAATSGTFDILSMNVAGLPSILNDNSVSGDKATNAGTIGADFAKYDYDVIHVQEVSQNSAHALPNPLTRLLGLQLSRLYLCYR
jgi:hypothetical protein